ncbi:MAG TPA: hypothetical protein PK280_10635 [Planctomycetota bacterium]|nr:hypothetical protein [Planctomycetota bacterium]
MIMRYRSPPSYTHTVSDAFLATVRKAVSARTTDGDMILALKGAVELEFPEDTGMRSFVLDNILEIAKLVCEGEKTIWIHRSSKLGVGIYVDE